MSNTILVAYATQYGSTQEVAEAIAETLRERGLEVDFQRAAKVRSLDGYRAVVLGAPLYMFKWNKDALGFLNRHREAITKRPIVIFALGPFSNNEKEWKEVHAQLDKELANFPWLTPVATEIFGGKYDPAKLGFPMNLMRNLVPDFKELPASDIRDWTAIRNWADNLVKLLS